MNYVIANLANNQVVFGPRSWNQGLFQSILSHELNITATLSYADPGQAVQINASVSILPVTQTIYPTGFNSVTQTLSGPTWALTPTGAIQKFVAVDKSVTTLQNELRTQAAALRYQAEVMGTTAVVAGSNVSVSTDRTGRQTYFQQHATATTTAAPFKFGSQFINANSTDFGNIVTAINSHVQRAFNWEANIVATINSTTTLTDLANIVLPTVGNITTQ
jgi:isochorismate synthase EntC